MKNKLKRLQLFMHSHHKKGIIFGSTFALTLLGLSIMAPRLEIYADPVDPEEILEADARVDEPMGGVSPSVIMVSSTDDDKYSVAVSKWYLFEEPYTTEIGEDDAFEAGKDYALRLVFTANEGYTFRNDTAFTVNGVETLSYGSVNEREFIFYDVPAAPEYTVNYTFEKVDEHEDVIRDSDLEAYVNDRKAEWRDSEIGQQAPEAYRTAWEALYVASDGEYKYPEYRATIFDGVSIAESCGGNSDDMATGDEIDSVVNSNPEECVVYNYTIQYAEVTVLDYVVPEDDEEEGREAITEVNLIVNAPKVGTEVTFDGEDFETQTPQPSVSVPAGVEYRLDDGNEQDGHHNYAYWITVEEGAISGFIGTLEKGETYQILVQMNTYEPEKYIFDKDVVVKVNGVALQSKNIFYSYGYLSVIVDVTPQDEAYSILEGADQAITADGSTVLTVKASGELDSLTGVKVDNELISEDKYDLASGSTIVTLKADYIASLDPGVHILTLVYNKGVVSTSFTIAAGSPDTGAFTVEEASIVSSNIAMLVTAFVLAIVGFATHRYYNR